MWKCNHCGAIFEEPDYLRYTEWHCNEFPEQMLFYICPECGEEGIDEYFENTEDEDG